MIGWTWVEKCPVCKSRSKHIYGANVYPPEDTEKIRDLIECQPDGSIPFQVILCECGYAYTDRHLDDLDAYYRDIYWTLVGHKMSKEEIHAKEEQRAQRQADLFPDKTKFKVTDDPLPTLLDVGCGNGYFLRLMDEKGYVCAGLDIDTKAAKWPLVYPSVDEIPEDTQFDWITMSHVLEHVPEPIEWLETFHRLRKPEGKIFIEVPSFSPAKGVFSLHHVGGYTVHSLQDVAMKAGFHIEWMRFLPKIEDVGGTIVLQMIVR